MPSLEFRRWKIEYSIITNIITWVKNVYRGYNNWFINSVVSSTTYLSEHTNYSATNVQLLVYRPFVNYLNNSFSTTKNNYFNLLNNCCAHNPQDLLLRALKRI